MREMTIRMGIIPMLLARMLLHTCGKIVRTDKILKFATVQLPQQY